MTNNLFDHWTISKLRLFLKKLGVQEVSWRKENNHVIWEIRPRSKTYVTPIFVRLKNMNQNENSTPESDAKALYSLPQPYNE